MTTLAKSIAYMVILVATLYSCNQNPSLQTYYVDNQEKQNFLSVDIPANFLNLDENSLTEEQKEAYESIEKLNMLAYRLNANNEAEYNTELQKVKAILDDPKYEELMRGGNAVDGKFVIKILGEEDDIEEFILFGSSNDKGFAIVRVLGDEMNPMKIMNLVSALDKANVDDAQVGEFMKFFK
jgi:hypothetical protein